MDWHGKILGYSIKSGDKMHGKTKSSVNTLKREVKKKVTNLRKNRKRKYLLIGSVLHSIQDYYAHSYVLDLSKYKKHADRYAYMANDKYGTKKEKEIYSSREKNKRYMEAVKKSKKYLEKVLK